MRKLDDTDIAILASLFKDPCITNKAIASQVDLAPSSCLERIKRLQNEGIILGASSKLNYNLLGGHIQAMVAVRLASHNRDTVARFQQELVSQKEVLSVFHMGGENDFLLHVCVPDALHLRDFIFTQVTGRDEVIHVETTLIYDHVTSTSLPFFG
ncbi:Lrp/AsnC family transcriptional regulator [Alteromonas lipolytica]|uniref:ArsR family transcriptional regulator n=1 Tax=Alteromonas lipolytica TaxID=1856405 RepID=A0A1E8FAV5_9ALTE|nr:Lrp/AsnC family transcriptional regulator [Alteromonas lipolytica]OFI32738.1 ArsR family transcriptional regulator [Alteromonas lipolytica]GGF73514.1 AsnC family transcriptional regulator [Alteromonas lipolytica]